MATNAFETAVKYYKARDFKNAQKYFEGTLEGNPKHTLALRYLGYTLSELKDYENAKKSLDRALSLKPTEFYAPDYKRLAEACQKTGEPHRAVKFYRTAIELDDKRNPHTLAALWEKAGDAASEFGDLQSSITFYNEALKHNPSASLYFAAARNYKLTENYPKAIVYFKKSLEKDAENIEALYALAYLQGALEQYDEATQAIKKCEQVCILKNDETNLKYCRKLQELLEKERKLPLQSPPERILSEEETKIKYLLDKFSKSKLHGEVMQLQPIVEVIGPINTDITRSEDNHISFLMSNESPDETAELSFSIKLKKGSVEPNKTVTTLEPGQYSELKFNVIAENVKKDAIDGEVKITSKASKKKKGSVWDVFRTMTEILIPFGGVMLDMMKKPFKKPDISKDFTLNVTTS